MNLRLCTRSQNKFNSPLRADNISGFKGVYFNKRANKYQAQLGHEGKHIYLGIYCNSKDAALAYDAAARKYFGEFANLNFPK